MAGTGRMSVAESLIATIMRDIDKMSVVNTLTPIVVSMMRQGVPQDQWEPKIKDALDLRIGALEVKVRNVVTKVAEAGLSDLDFTSALGAYMEMMKRSIPFIITELAGKKIIAEAEVKSVIDEIASKIRNNRANQEVLQQVMGHLNAMLSRVSLRDVA